MKSRIGKAGLGLATALLLAGSASVHADSHAKMMSCTIEISRTELGFIVTVGGGRGTLTCDGKTHKLRVGGLQIGGMGLAGMDATGEVTNLKQLSDINGNYSRLEAGITAIKGKGVINLANDKGVKMNLSVSSAGADVKFGGGGMRIRLEQ